MADCPKSESIPTIADIEELAAEAAVRAVKLKILEWVLTAAGVLAVLFVLFAAFMAGRIVESLVLAVKEEQRSSQAVAKSETPAEPKHLFEIGQRVRAKSGKYIGLQGVVGVVTGWSTRAFESGVFYGVETDGYQWPDEVPEWELEAVKPEEGC